MNRINNLFNSKPSKVLNIFTTAGFPELNGTIELIENLQNSGVDLIEIGIPYSDPLADGPTIQESSARALENGMSLKLLLKQLENFRNRITVPVLLMGYYNCIIQYGESQFFEDCNRVGIDGLIIPDMPLNIYIEEKKALFEQNNIKPVFLITPNTSEERIRTIDEVSDAFIYVVSSSSTTGKTAGFSEEAITYFKKINQMQLKNPTLIGFGISNQHSYNVACEYANGAIIGSAFIRHLKENGTSKKAINSFIKGIRNEIYTVLN